jgi:serine/threonine protein kinase
MKHVNPRDQFRNLSEVYFLKRVDHPNIVRYVSSYVTMDELWIVTEFMEGGTLSQVCVLS